MRATFAANHGRAWSRVMRERMELGTADAAGLVIAGLAELDPAAIAPAG